MRLHRSRKEKKEKADKKTRSHHSQYESSSLSLMMPSKSMAVSPLPSPLPQTRQRKDTVKGIDYNENLKFVLTTGPTISGNEAENKEQDKNIDSKEDELEKELEDEEWWLMLNDKRNKVIEGLHVTTEENGILTKLAIFASRILKPDAISSTDKITKLYIPIDINAYPSTQFRCLASLFDGVIVSKLLNLINEDYIDFRGIHKPNPDKPYPLKRHEINENVSVILSSLKSMGIVLKRIYTVKDWWDPSKHCELLINLLTEIASHTLDRFCSYKEHPELILLKKKTEPVSSLSFYAGEKWIIRWINFMLKRAAEGNANIDVAQSIKFNKDFMKILGLLKKRNSIIMMKPNASKSDSAKAFIKIAKHSFNVDTPIEPEDFTNNNRFCQNYFAAQIFDKLNGLQLPPDMEQELQDEKEKQTDNGWAEGEKEAIMAWLNSFGLRNRVDNLDDISSGLTLLKVLDRLKRGCVSWKKVHLKVRHKFDHVVNCNYVVETIKKQLGLKMVNVSGMDIVDKNNLIIKSILWRIMRYQSVKILSDLQFGSNVNKVNNTEITKWCNEKLTLTFGDGVRCKQIKKLNDSSLTTGIYYLELIRAIRPSAIDDDLVNLDVPPMSSQIKKDFKLHDKHYKKRRQNLKYAMTIIRRYGVDLFINVDDLFRLESRAVVSMLAAVMTISLSQEKIAHDEEEEEEEEQEEEEKEEKEEKKEDKKQDRLNIKKDGDYLGASPEDGFSMVLTPAGSPGSPDSVISQLSPAPPRNEEKSSNDGKSADLAANKSENNKKNSSNGKGKKGKKKKPKTPDMMANIDELDFDSVLDEVDSDYNKKKKKTKSKKKTKTKTKTKTRKK